MDIHTYLKKNRGRKAHELAASAGTSIGYLRLLGYGLRKPSADIAIRLEHASKGELIARELRPDLPWPTPLKAHEDATA